MSLNDGTDDDSDNTKSACNGLDFRRSYAIVMIRLSDSKLEERMLTKFRVIFPLAVTSILVLAVCIGCSDDDGTKPETARDGAGHR